MAKTDNLTDFLTGVAGAIRTKKGTTALINPQDFESEIGSIDTAKPEQTKTLTVTENGTQTVKPDTGKVLSGVTVTTNVPATPTEEKTVDLAMASGNQVVTPASGKHLTKVTITKPATLAAGNIKSGVNIGGVTGTLSPAKTEQAKTVDLAMASGNQVVSPDSGKVLSGVTITKPATLVASNIKKGVTIGGVAGSYAPTFTTETKTVALAMGSGNQVISKSSGKDGMTQVTVTKPSTMLPANIKKGVNIGGVTGTYEGEHSKVASPETWVFDYRRINTGLLTGWDELDYEECPLFVPGDLSDNRKYFFNITYDSSYVYIEAVPTDSEGSWDRVTIATYSLDEGDVEWHTTDPATNRIINFEDTVTGTPWADFVNTFMIKQTVAIVQPSAPTGTAPSSKAPDSKSVTITSNGTTTITPDAPHDAMKDVKVTVNVPGETVRDFPIPMNMSGLTVSDSHGEIYKIPSNSGLAIKLPARIIGNRLTLTTSWSHWDSLPTFTGTTPTLVSQTTQTLIYELKDGTTGISNIGAASCLIKGTLITLADGSKKPVEDITYDDELLVWNFYKGCFDKAKPRWIKIAQTANVYNKLTFDNGATLGLVGEGGTQGYHRIFNEQARLFTHTGVPETPVGTITFAEDCTKPTLVKQELVHEEVEFYNVITEIHFNLFANGILTSCKNSNKYYIENMKYVTDKELMTDAEIEQDMLNREPIKLKKEIK